MYICGLIYRTVPTVLIRLKPRYPLMGIPLMILDHIVAQDVRGLEIFDIPKNPNLDPDLRRDSAPAARRRPCKDVVTTNLPIVLILVLVLYGTRNVL